MVIDPGWAWAKPSPGVSRREVHRWGRSGQSVTITQVIWGPQWTPHFCGALCSVTVPNETPRSCGSALLICGSGRLLGERAATASTASPSAASSKSVLLLIDRGGALQCFSTSAAVAFASRAETIYHFSGRLLQSLQDGWKAAWNKSNLGSWSNIQALASWNPLCSYNIARSEKSNLVLLQSPVEVKPQ